MPLPSRPDIDLRIGEIAARQGGLITTDDLSALGVSKHHVHFRLRSGDLMVLAPRVYAVRGLPLTDGVGLRAALLEASGRSAISHQSAAAIWEFPGFSLRPFHIVRRRDGTFPPGVLGTVHTTRRLPDTHVADPDGLLVTTPTRTLFDLAACVSVPRLERLIDHAWSRRLTSGKLLHRTLKELSGRGQTGITAMRELLDERGPDYRPPESGLEARCAQILRENFLTGFEAQVELGDEIGFVARVDLVDRERRIVLEIDSDLHHTSVSDRRADEIRQARLEAAGWLVVRVSEFDVWHRPGRVVEIVRWARSRPRTA